MSGRQNPAVPAIKVLVYRVGSSVWLWEMSEVLACLTQGLGNREIASTLKISMATVRSHISHLLPKTECHEPHPSRCPRQRVRHAWQQPAGEESVKAEMERLSEIIRFVAPGLHFDLDKPRPATVSTN